MLCVAITPNLYVNDVIRSVKMFTKYIFEKKIIQTVTVYYYNDYFYDLHSH